MEIEVFKKAEIQFDSEDELQRFMNRAEEEELLTACELLRIGANGEIDNTSLYVEYYELENDNLTDFARLEEIAEEFNKELEKQ